MILEYLSEPNESQVFLEEEGRRVRVGGYVETEAEVEVIQTRAKDCSLQKMEKKRKGFSPRTFRRNIALLAP